MKKINNLFIVTCLCFLFANFTSAQSLCDIDANYLAPEFSLTEDYTELCGNNVSSNITINLDQEVLFRTKTSLLLTDGFEVKAGGTLQTAECNIHVSNLNSAPLSENIRLSPNPTSGDVLVEIELDAISDLEFTLVNPFGQVVNILADRQSYQVGTNSVNINISEVPAGVYILNVTDGKRISSKKIIKQ